MCRSLCQAHHAQLQAFTHSVDARVLGGDAQRFVVDVDADRSRHAQRQRSEREHARPCSYVEHGVGPSDRHGFIECFETECGGWMQACAERLGIDQSEGVRLCVDVKPGQSEYVRCESAEG